MDDWARRVRVSCVKMLEIMVIAATLEKLRFFIIKNKTKWMRKMKWLPAKSMLEYRKNNEY